jgi:hypothetical protein
MAKDKISQYDSTSAGANLNTDIAGINIDEGCAPSGINNAIRTLMAQIRDLQSGVSGDSIPVAAGGTGSTTSASARSALGLAIGTDVLAPPSGTAILKANSGGALANATAGTDYVAIGTASTFTASQRGTITTDNDGSFDMNVTNNFVCTPTATFALTFTNITAGQSGYVLLVNTGGHAVTAAATTKVGTTFLTGVSAAGTYLLSYFSNGTNVYVTASGALA